MIYKANSRKSATEIDAALRRAALKHHFGVLSVINLQEKMRDKGVEYGNECHVYEVCNPHQAKRALEADGAVSTALPCRIAVYGAPGQYTIATMLPVEMMNAFGAPAVAAVAGEVQKDLIAIIDESA